MKKFSLFAILVPFIAAAANHAVVVTASNATANQLLVYRPDGTLVQTVPTQGQGGVSGNAGGIEALDNLVAVVNFASVNVSMLEYENGSFQVTQLVPAISNPVSVAFGNGHLYILGTTEVESHRMEGSNVNTVADGEVALVKADGSAAQVGVVRGQLVIAEKSNMIETVNLSPAGAVVGTATPVKNIPANVNTPFGLVTSGTNAYVTIAHANEISLVRNGAILTVTGSGTQMSPCWLTLVGPYLFSSNSPSLTVSRYLVYGTRIIQAVPVAAQLTGQPTDIASGDGLLAVIDGINGNTGLSIFTIDEDGNLTLKSGASITGAANGVAIVHPGN
jgi:hypothetical protein